MKILLAVDDSPYSAEAARTIAERPWPPSTIVRVLSVIQHFVPSMAELGFERAGSLQQLWEQRKEDAKNLTSRVAAALTLKGLKADPVVRDGDPRATIVDEAREWSADLIVVGSHGHAGLTRWLLGSVAQSVVSHAPCSVEVARIKEARRSAHRPHREEPLAEAAPAWNLTQ